MKTNKLFSFPRFGRLLAANWQLHYKPYLLTMAGGFVVMFLINYMNLYDSFSLQIQQYSEVFMLSLLLLAFVIANAFPAFANKRSTANYLLIPASGFEKLMAQFLVYFLGVFVAFLSLFWLSAYTARACAIALCEAHGMVADIAVFDYKAFFNETLFNSDLETTWLEISSIIGIAFFLFAARLFFGKWAAVKSILSFAVLFFLVACFFVILSHVFFPKQTEGFNIALSKYYIGKAAAVSWWVYFLMAMVVVTALPLAYHKLKEKQV